MNIFHTHYEFLKNEASLLLKNVQQSHAERVSIYGDESKRHSSTLPTENIGIAQADSYKNAVARFQQLSSFTTLSTDETSALNDLQLKHALNVIAVENNYESWNELKSALDNAAETSPLAEIKEQFYPKGFTTYWNIWFAKYSQAKKVLNDTKNASQGKGFLLPYKNQFFIVEEHFVDSIGLPHTLQEWNEIDNDWIHPKNVKAWLKLNEMYVKAMKERE